MTTGTVAALSPTPQAFAVRFKDLERWSVDSFRRVEWCWPADVIRPIGEVLSHKRNEVDDAIDRVEVPIIEKISFGGVVSVTQPKRRTGYKGRLFWAESGDLAYSKIRVKQGSLAVVPDCIPRLAVSAEYPVYSIDAERADGRYLELVVRSSAFLRVLDGIAHGGGTKTRIPPDEFEKQSIPLPPLSVQRAIVSAWEQAQAEVADTRLRIAELEGKIEADFLAALGLPQPTPVDLPKCFAVQWIDFRRWSVSYSQRAQVGADLTQGTYPVVPLGDCLQSLQYGTSEKANSAGRGTPILRIKNIKNGEVDTTDLKHIALPDSTRASLRLDDGDILIIRTSGSRELVGTCAVFHGEEEQVFASYLIRLRTEPEKALADYLTYFVNCSLGQTQVDAVSRQIMQNNINTQEIRALEIPLPPLSVQRRIVNNIGTGRRKIAALKADAAQKVQQAKVEVEAMILGEKPVPRTSQA